MDPRLEQLAEPYARLRAAAGLLCEENAAPDEHRLQALWQDVALRPKMLSLIDGSPVEVLSPGRWNHSVGPDFQDAVVAIKGLIRRGDVELHVRPSDWDAHGHADDPAYSNLILHVTWFDKPSAKTLPSGVPSLALQPFMERDEPFDFTQVVASRADVPGGASGWPCGPRLASEPGALDRLLVHAGYYRLLNKSRILTAAMTSADPTQVFYEFLMATMGYRQNVVGFRRLAQEVPFTRLIGKSTLERFAMLAGVGGLLKNSQRALWDLWWQSGAQPPLEPIAWDLRALRPQNHPYRRLAGVMGVLQHLDALLDTSLGKVSEKIVEASCELRESLGLKGALIGEGRANAMVINLLVPYRLALGSLDPERLRALPTEEVSMPMKEAWSRLSKASAPLPKDGLRQQGLLQIYADFCHNPRLVCATCPIALEA